MVYMRGKNPTVNGRKRGQGALGLFVSLTHKSGAAWVGLDLLWGGPAGVPPWPNPSQGTEHLCQQHRLAQNQALNLLIMNHEGVCAAPAPTTGGSRGICGQDARPWG